jgi:hypothetical protein
MNVIANIPGRILQTGKNRALPLLAQASAANLKGLNPEFEYLFFDDADVQAFLDREFPEYRPVFNAFPHRIQRFDFFRYLAVYRHGGFYFDLDVLLGTGLQPLLNSTCVFPFEELTLNRYLRSHHRMDWEIGNYAFGASAGHPFLKAVIENCVRAQQDAAWLAPMMKGIPALFRRDFYVLNTTGPGLVTRTLAENPQLAKTVSVLFPDDVCDSESWHQFGKFGVHLMDGSWRTHGSFLKRKLASMWENWNRGRLLAESQTLGQTRSHPAVQTT